MIYGKIFKREYTLVVDTLEIHNLNIKFKVEKKLKPEPNTCDIEIFNLAPKHRKQLEALEKVPIKFVAGYEKMQHTVFFGELQQAYTEVEGPNLITKMETGRKKEVSKARLHVPIGPGYKIDDVFNKVIAQIGVGSGNSRQYLEKLKTQGTAIFGTKGRTLSGQALQILTDLCDSVDLEWSIQDETIQLIQRGQPLFNESVEIGPESGLLGHTSVDGKGILHCTTELIPGIKPGAVIVMNSESQKGGYRIEEVVSEGEWDGPHWQHKIKAKRY